MKNRYPSVVISVMFWLALCWTGTLVLTPGPLRAQPYEPTRTGASLNLGYTYDPGGDIWFSQISFFRLYDYDRVWRHRAPEALRFKVEASMGGSRLENADIRMNASVNIFALYYLAGTGEEGVRSRVRPYVEAGIGGIYTDYRVPGQDYRINFNPQAGVGIEMDTAGGNTVFAAVRLHHLSNGGIGSSNRGQNSVVCLFGTYF